MVISQAAVVNLKSFNATTQSDNRPLVGKVTGFSNGVLTVQVGSDTYNLQIDQNVFNVGESITFLLSEGGVSAQIFKDLPLPIGDNVLLSITSQLTELLSTLDTLIEDLDESNGDLKKNLLSLLSLVKKEIFPQTQLDKILKNIKVAIDKNSDISPSIKKSVNELLRTFNEVGKDISTIDKNIQTSALASDFKDIIVNVKGESSDKVVLFNSKEELSHYLNKFSSDKNIINLVNKIDGRILVHMDPIKDDSVAMHLFKGDDLPNVLKHISHKIFESNFMREQMPSHLQAILESTGELKMSSAKILDSIIAKNFPNLDSELSKNNTTMMLSQLLTSIESMDKEKIMAIEKLIPYMLKTFKDDVSELISSSEKNIASSIEKIFNSINKSFLSDSGKDFFTSLFKLTGIDRENSILTFPQSNNLIENSKFESLKSLLLDFIINSEKGEEPRLKSSISDENNKIAKDATVLSNEKGYQPSEKGLESTDVREKIEQVINKIEAMQVLAKKVPTANGESQLLSVPININNEITELRIQFKKENKKEKNVEKQSTSVLLNMELSLIGEVSAQMKFFNNKDLSINMLLSNKPTLDWFVNNKIEMLEALKTLNFNSVKLDFGNLVEMENEKKHSLLKNDRLDLSA